MSGHCSCHLSSTGCAGKELPAEMQQSCVGRMGSQGSFANVRAFSWPVPAPVPWHSTGSSCRDVQEGSGTFPALPMELCSHWGVSHCFSPGHNQTSKQTSAVRFKPQETQLMLSFVICCNSALTPAQNCCSVLGRSSVQVGFGWKIPLCLPLAFTQCCLLVLTSSPCLPC